MSFPGRMDRRQALRVGIAGLASLTMPEWLRIRSAVGSPSGERTALILIWLPGGASHIETYDPKPMAPTEYRGPFSTIDTQAAGMQLCELLPEHARIADKFSLLRSVVHTGFCHQQGTHQLLTGHPVLELKLKPDHPDIFSVAHKLRFDAARGIPNYVGIPPVNYGGAAYLGTSFEPFGVFGDPNDPQFHVPNIGVSDETLTKRIEDRIQLRKGFDQFRRDLDRQQSMQAFDEFEGQAWNLLTSESAERAFDLGQEPESVRDRYGRNAWGQQCLLARRLLEAGVELLTVQFGGPLCGRVQNWDDHAVNHNVFEGMKYRCSFFDRAVSALITDLYERGLDRKTMVVVTGEFGRTPKISYAASTGGGVSSAAAGVEQPGRDHWPRATSILFAGGGIRTGQVVGGTDRRGEDAVDRIVSRGDFLATMYRHLGIDVPHVAFENFSGRPVPILQEGAPISELTAVS